MEISQPITIRPRLIVKLPGVIFIFLLTSGIFYFSIIYWDVFCLAGVVLWAIEIYSLLEFKTIVYRLRDNELHKEYGLFTLHHGVIPFRNITNFRIIRGIWDRMLGLSEIHIQTAGTPFVEMVMPGLDKEDAKKIEKIIR